MAEQPRGFGRGGEKGGERGGRGGDRRGGRGGDRGGRGGKGGPGGRGGQKEDLDAWVPVTKLGRLVKHGKIASLDVIFRYSIPIKEPQIIDWLYKGKEDALKEEVMQIIPVQKQTQAGQRTRFKAFVCVGDGDGHLGLGCKVHKEVQGAIKGAISDAKTHFIPIRRGYWGNKIGKPHTVPVCTTGKGGSVRLRLVPAPRGTGIVAAPSPKKVLQFAGIQDVYTSSIGCTKTRGNFLKATFASLGKTYQFLTPDFWGKTKFEMTPNEEHAAFLQSIKHPIQHWHAQAHQ